MDQDEVKKSSKESTSDLLRNKDPQALEELLKRYRPLLRAVIAGEIEPNLMSKLDASDIVQEACAEIAKAFPKIESTKSPQFIAFMRQVVINKLNDVRRKFLHSQKRDVKLERKCTSGEFATPSDRGSLTPLEIVLEYELWERIESAVQKLPAEVQKVIHFRFVGDMSFVEIGKLLGRTEDDVRISMGRWLKRIRAEVISSSSSSA
ncbi:MAG: sigma-70 family RNA polymerase sigma factor [Pirellulales bacterium]